MQLEVELLVGGALVVLPGAGQGEGEQARPLAWGGRHLGMAPTPELGALGRWSGQRGVPWAPDGTLSAVYLGNEGQGALELLGHGDALDGEHKLGFVGDAW